MIKNIFINTLIALIIFTVSSNAQNVDFGTYGEINFQQELVDTADTKGDLNINRLFLTMKSQLNQKLKFSAALELNDNNNFSVEHAYFDYKIAEKVNWRTGLVLVPMGKLNVDHISTTYFGATRFALDTYIVPTTWNAYGTGITANLIDANLRYQAYIVNGLNDIGLNGFDGIRNGIQGGANAEFSNPNFTAKLDYYGFDNINFGISAYTGSTNNNTISNNDSLISNLSVGMLGLDAQYKENNLFLNGQLIYSELNGANNYNLVTGSDLGTKMLGYYLNVGYEYELANGEYLIPFVTFERYATHYKVGDFGSVNDAYNRNLTTIGVSYKASENVVYKLDYQMFKNDASLNEQNFLNAAVHFMFR